MLSAAVWESRSLPALFLRARELRFAGSFTYALFLFTPPPGLS
jgi:hypothetical protein